ncbi:CHAD domain-containing protein [soil metagenome]
MQRHLDVSRTRYLPAVSGDGFVLEAGEPLGAGLQRISIEQLDGALRGLAAGTDLDDAIHNTRKALKRLRAVLRLVRFQVGERVYRYENKTLRDAARALAPVRDGAVAVHTVTTLAARFEGSLPVDVFDDLAERLDLRAVRLRARVVDETDAVPRLVTTLERARARFAGWPVTEGEKKAYGTVIGDGFDAIGPGLALTYGRGRLEMKRAFGSTTADNHHLWRKRVKYLRHQMEVLQPLWPEVVGATALSLDRLGELLGEEHDLATLLDLLAVDGGMCPDPVERALFAALAQHRRSELQAAARVLGTRIYFEKANQYAARIEAYWDSNRLPLPVGFLPVS